jgi:protein involved in polysaccharide export with SLBB domain
MRRLLAPSAIVLLCLSLLGCVSTNEQRVSELLSELHSLREETQPAAGQAESPQAAGVPAQEGGYQAAISAPEPTVPLAPLPAPEQRPAAGSARMRGSPAGAPNSIEALGPDVPDSGLPAGPSVKPGSFSSVLSIQPDSLLQVKVEEDPSLDGNYAVNSIGAIGLGYVGPVILYNKTELQAAARIAEVLRSRDFKRATVKVRILRASYDRVQITGLVNSPSTIKIGAGESIALNDALLRVDGVHPSARNPRVKVVRGGMLSPLPFSMPGEDFALADAEGRPLIPEVFLHNNDLVQVYTGVAVSPSEPAGTPKEILVLGEVKRPGMHRFAPGEPGTIMHLIFRMGGLPPYANAKAIRVMRVNGDGVEQEHRVDARRVLTEGSPADDFALEDGDRVIVPARRISLF